MLEWKEGIDITSPPIGISVEPVQNGKATYLPLIAATSNAKAQGEIVLRLILKNTGTMPVKITGITYSFPSSNSPAFVMQGVEQYFAGYYSTSGGSTFSPGQSKTFTNGRVALIPGDDNSLVNNMVFLDDPMPATIEIKITCKDFTEPSKISLPLAPHKSSTPEGSYLYPFSATDLRTSEFYVGAAVHWANGGANGTQIFAHDLGCEGYDPAAHAWSRFLPGRNGTKVTDYRCFGKPVRSMADGVVESYHDGLPDNTVLGQFPNPTPNPATGNSITIVSGTEKITYCHFENGSIPAALKTPGAKVKAGQIIGRVGNSGNTTEPHTHIECAGTDASAPLRPIPFRDAYGVAETAIHPPNPAGPWSKLQAQGLPVQAVALWPAATPPAWYPPGWAEVAHFGVPESSYQTYFDRAKSSGYRPVFVDGYEVGGSTFFNVIFRPVGNVAWEARHGLDAMSYQEEFNTLTKAGYHLTNVTSYVQDGAVRYAAIFDKADTPAWKAYHGLDQADHQQRFDAWTKEGFRPVNVSVTAAGGTRLFAGLYVQRDVGSFVHLAGLDSDGYQKAWNDNVAAGRQLAYLSAFNEGGTPRFSAIFQQKLEGSGNVEGRHGLTGAQLQTQYDAHLATGFLTRAIVGYESGGAARFAAAWRKP